MPLLDSYVGQKYFEKPLSISKWHLAWSYNHAKTEEWRVKKKKWSFLNIQFLQGERTPTKAKTCTQCDTPQDDTSRNVIQRENGFITNAWSLKVPYAFGFSQR